MTSKNPPPDGYREIGDIIKEHEADPRHAAALDRARTRIKIAGIPALGNDKGTYPKILELPPIDSSED